VAAAQRGLTLIELMVTLAVMVVLMAVAVPSMSDFTANNQVVAAKSAFASAVALARTEAASVRSVAALLGVRYRALADGEFNHTSALVLLDDEGRVVARTERLGSVPDPEFLAAVKAALTGSPGQ